MRRGRALAVGDGVDQVAGPWATSPPAQIRGCDVRSVVGVDLDAAAAAALELDAGEDVEIGGLADGEDHRVGGEHRLGPGDERRVEAVVGVEHRRRRRSSRGR